MSKNRIDSFAAYAGLATVLVEWLALLLYFLQQPAYFGGKYPISYFATLPQTKLIFTLCYVLAGLFFWIFVRHHLHKFYPAPLKIIGLSMILFALLAIVPFNPTDPVSDVIHSTLGWSSAVLFAGGLFIMARNAKDKYVYRASLIAALLSTLLILAFAISPKESNLIFAFESGSWLVWQLWIFWITYYTYKHKGVK